MASSLDTNLLNLAISDIIDEAREYIIVISPYLKLCTKIRDQFIDADKRGVSVIFVYGKKELDADTFAWLKTLKNVYIGYSENLHAKYYANEEKSIITSMNLYEFSQVNNYELGILLNKNDFDRDTFIVQSEFVDKIIDRSEPKFATISYSHEVWKKLTIRHHTVNIDRLDTIVDNTSGSADKHNDTADKKIAYCIRCGKEIPFQPDHYFCYQCFSKWSTYKNLNYEEKFCHFCGKPAKTSASRPSCLNCYQKNNRSLENNQH